MNRWPTRTRRVAGVVLVAALLALASSRAHADINPWIVSSVYNPRRWDTGGPYAATPWIHAPANAPGMGWGMLDPAWAIETGKWDETPSFSGSWGGARGKLLEAGFGFSSAYFGQLAANPVGGAVEGGASWRGDLTGDVFLDLQRIAGWDRTYFTASANWKAGNPTLSSNDVGNDLPVQLDSFDDPNAIRLVHLALSKQLLDNQAEMILGRIITSEDFASLRLACTSLNQAICSSPVAADRNLDFPTFPNAVWGGVFKLKPGSSWYAQVGSYLVYPDFAARTDHGVNFSAPEGSGVLSLAEFSYLTGQEIGEPGLRGRYIVGALYSSEEQNKFRDPSEEKVRGFYGFHVLGQQMIWSPDAKGDRGVSLWGALSYAPPDRDKVQFMAAGGALWQGLVASRPQDGLAFIGAYTSWSNHIPDTTGETLLEVNYRVTIAPWFWVEPDVQGIINPSASTTIPDALVVGFGLGFVL